MPLPLQQRAWVASPGPRRHDSSGKDILETTFPVSLLTGWRNHAPRPAWKDAHQTYTEMEPSNLCPSLRIIKAFRMASGRKSVPEQSGYVSKRRAFRACHCVCQTLLLRIVFSMRFNFTWRSCSSRLPDNV